MASAQVALDFVEGAEEQAVAHAVLGMQHLVNDLHFFLRRSIIRQSCESWEDTVTWWEDTCSLELFQESKRRPVPGARRQNGAPIPPTATPLFFATRETIRATRLSEWIRHANPSPSWTPGSGPAGRGEADLPRS